VVEFCLYCTVFCTGYHVFLLLDSSCCPSAVLFVLYKQICCVGGRIIILYNILEDTKNNPYSIIGAPDLRVTTETFPLLM
jgi:hypothetical protein